MSEAPVHRFYLDEDVPSKAAVVGRGLGLDVVAAVEVGPLPRHDHEHLDIAARDRRMVVTNNRDDFVDLTHTALAVGKPHAGVLVLARKLKRDAPIVAHALRRWSAARAPLQPYEIQYLSG